MPTVSLHVSDRFRHKIRRVASRHGITQAEIFERALDLAIAAAPPPTALAITDRAREPLPACGHFTIRVDRGVVFCYGNLAIAIDKRGRFHDVDLIVNHAVGVDAARKRADGTRRFYREGGRRVMRRA